MTEGRDYFICHALPDKALYAWPLVRALQAAGMSCWLDEAEVLPGDSLTAAIDHGLETSQFVLALLTPRSVGRGWSAYEIRSTLARQVEDGATRLVPVLADFDAEGLNRLLSQFPALRDRVRLSWEDGIARLVAQLERRQKREYSTLWEEYHEPSYSGPVWFSVLTPAPAHELRVHARWGRWHWAWNGSLSGGRGPLVFTHLKATDRAAAVKLLVTTSDPVSVQFGTGQPSNAGEPTGRWWDAAKCPRCLDNPSTPWP